MNRSPFFSGMCAPSQANQYIQLYGTWPMLLCFDRVLSSRDCHRSSHAEIHFDDLISRPSRGSAWLGTLVFLAKSCAPRQPTELSGRGVVSQ